jgi:tRNA A58 N-methylase Trm61
VADGRSVRPSHQMVGHTGFITVASRAMGEPEEPGPDQE